MGTPRRLSVGLTDLPLRTRLSSLLSAGNVGRMRVCRVVRSLAIVLTVGCTGGPISDLPSPQVRTVAASAPSAMLVGSTGCDARGCHGELLGVAPANTPFRESATRWRTWDKHGRAFAALGTPRSTAMIALLRRGDGSWQDAPAEPRCLACHATPTVANRSDPEAKARQIDGVGCEACHAVPGRATGEWLTEHWQPGGVAACYAGGSLRKLGTATDRAALCVGCHVGAAATAAVPAREVTHELIAAGHPRLFFELLTFLDLMPPHWGEQRDTEPKPAVWQAGQIEAAKTALTLAADRAARDHGPWPELADRNCFACHHRLQSSTPKPGWTSPLVSAPLANLLGWGETERQTLATTNRETAVSAWRELCDRLTRGPIDAARLRAAVGVGVQDWDAAAQGYYALRAADRPAEPLRRLADALRLPRGPNVVNSPIEYHPSVVARLLAEAAGQ